MRTFLDIIKSWPDMDAFAGDIGVIRTHAETIKTRRRIPVLRWRSVLAAAARRGIDLRPEHLAEAEMNYASGRVQAETEPFLLLAGPRP